MMDKNDSPSSAISMLPDTSKLSLQDDFLKVTPMTTIEALKDMKMVITLLSFLFIFTILTYFVSQI